jgi:hypothetical protein
MNVPGIYVYAGTIKPGKLEGAGPHHRLAFEAVGAYAAGKMSEEDFDGIEKNACPTVGACGGMYTANTMSSSFEALGMSLLGSSQMASPDPEKADSAAESARVLVEAIRRDLAARHHHAQVDRERGRAGHGDRRLDQRGAALPRDRPCAPKSSGPSTISSACAARCRCCAISSPPAATSRSTSTAPAACRRC